MLTTAQHKVVDTTLSHHTSIVAADPGTGKSHVLRETAIQYKTSYPANKVLSMAFGKANAESLREKLPEGINVATVHSTALSALRGKFRVKSDKYRWEAKNQGIEDYSTQVAIADVIDELQSSLVGYNNIGLTDALIEQAFLLVTDSTLSLWEEELETPPLMPIIKTLFNQKNMKVITFTEMLYYSLLQGNFPHYDLVLLDECQDQSRLMREVISRIAHQATFLAVGDPKQSIMGFMRGSDTRSFQNLIATFRIPEQYQLSLTESFRCPELICAYAAEIYPGITSMVQTHTGSVSHLPMLQFQINPPTGSDVMIISRTNRPLIRLAYKYLRAKIPFRMHGEFAKRLAVQAAKIQRKLPRPSQSIPAFIRLCEDTKAKELLGASDKPKSYQQTVLDKWDTIISLAEDCDNVTSFVEYLEQLGSQGKGTGPLLCTAHRSKGLEANEVYILNPELFPHPMAESDDELIQEKNLFYVAATRSLDKLVLLT